jgi:hypothetical protein
MGGAYSTYVGGGEVYTGLWWGKLREETTWKTGVDGRLI